jgi:hypothetical protein
VVAENPRVAAADAYILRRQGRSSSRSGFPARLCRPVGLESPTDFLAGVMDACAVPPIELAGPLLQPVVQRRLSAVERRPVVFGTEP